MVDIDRAKALTFCVFFTIDCSVREGRRYDRCKSPKLPTRWGVSLYHASNIPAANPTACP